MNKDFQKLITLLQDEGISQYGITLLEGFAVQVENMLPKKTEINGFALAQISELCQMVDRGCKPVALVSVRVDEYQKVIDLIYNGYSLHAIGKQLNESFFSVLIFKNPTLRYILQSLPEEPKTPSEHALLGYLFGYDTDSICNYIRHNCELEEPNLM
jgi:hypothetical protein